METLGTDIVRAADIRHRPSGIALTQDPDDLLHCPSRFFHDDFLSL
jgi:hypothetical protein